MNKKILIATIFTTLPMGNIALSKESTDPPLISPIKTKKLEYKIVNLKERNMENRLNKLSELRWRVKGILDKKHRNKIIIYKVLLGRVVNPYGSPGEGEHPPYK